MSEFRTLDLRSPRSFAVIAAGITVICATLIHSSLYARNPGVAAWGVTLDLMITIPAIFYFLVVRSGRASIATMIPLFAVCGILARFIIPAASQQLLHSLGIAISAPLEIFAIAWLIARARSARRLLGQGDLIDSIRNAALELTRNPIVAEIAAGEIVVWYYALFSWRKKPAVRSGETAITVHQNSGWGAVLAALFIVLAGEAFGMHLVLQHWSRTAAWILTALEAYSVLWFIGDFRALILRPTIIDAESLRVRFGLRWNFVVPRSAIESVERITSPSQYEKRKGMLKIGIINDPTILVTLREPVMATAMLGIRRLTRELAIAPDDPEAFMTAMAT